jgi:hypothetical protein
LRLSPAIDAKTASLNSLHNSLKVAEKMYYDVDRGIGNLSCVIRYPSPEQAEIIDGWLHDLNDRLNDIQRTLPLERSKQER